MLCYTMIMDLLLDAKLPSKSTVVLQGWGFKREPRFTSKSAANEIIHKIEEVAKPLEVDVHKKNYKIMLKDGRKCNLKIATEVFQIAPSLHTVEVRKAKGHTLECHKLLIKDSSKSDVQLFVCVLGVESSWHP